MCGDWERAADITQEALIRVYVAWPRLRQDHGLRTYARRAVVSVAIEQARKRSSREVPAAHLGDRRVEDAADAVVDRLLLMTALAELPPRQRACVVLRYYDDLSVEAVAEALGCRAGTVKSQTARGLEALRAAYARHGGELLGSRASMTSRRRPPREHRPARGAARGRGGAPYDESDLRDVLAAGSRRVRRRAAFGVGASALVAVGAVLASVAVGSTVPTRSTARRSGDLDLGRAEKLDLDVLASVRTTSRDQMDESSTTIASWGSRRTAWSSAAATPSGGEGYGLGLLDPETGSTDWLPPPPAAAANRVVELTADRLVLFGPR